MLFAGCSANDDVPAPQISNVVPSHATAGSLVTVNGSEFCQLPGMNPDPVCDTIGTVQFGAVPGTPTMWTDTAVLVEVPAGINGRVDLTLIARGRPSNAVTFTAE